MASTSHGPHTFRHEHARRQPHTFHTTQAVIHPPGLRGAAGLACADAAPLPGLAGSSAPPLPVPAATDAAGASAAAAIATAEAGSASGGRCVWQPS